MATSNYTMTVTTSGEIVPATMVQAKGVIDTAQDYGYANLAEDVVGTQPAEHAQDARTLVVQFRNFRPEDGLDYASSTQTVTLTRRDLS